MISIYFLGNTDFTGGVNGDTHIGVGPSKFLTRLGYISLRFRLSVICEDPTPFWPSNPFYVGNDTKFKNVGMPLLGRLKDNLFV